MAKQLSHYVNGLPSEGWKKEQKKSIAKKMESKTYTNTRCGKCGKFGHHHSTHQKLGSMHKKNLLKAGTSAGNSEDYWNRHGMKQTYEGRDDDWHN